jgi:hypothetical protein
MSNDFLYIFPASLNEKYSAWAKIVRLGPSYQIAHLVNRVDCCTSESACGSDQRDKPMTAIFCYPERFQGEGELC